MSGLSYTINEFLYRNIPVITTPLPYLEEIGFKDNETGYIVEFDCSNVDEVAKKIKNKPKFKFEHLQDSYDNIFTNKKSHYAEDINKLVTVECIYQMGFKDIDIQVQRTKGEQWQVNLIRAEELLQNPQNLIRIVEE